MTIQSPKKSFFNLKFSSVVALLIGVLFISPVIYLFIEATNYKPDSLKHLWDTQLFNYFSNSLKMAGLTTILSLIWGLPTAFLLARYKFTASGFFQILCFLPLAYPLYLTAYVYTDLFDYGGIVQSTLRSWNGWKKPDDYYFPAIRSLGGAALIFSFSLYPYVMLVARTAFRYSYIQLNQSAQILGASKLRTLFTVNIPLARPAIVVGASLVAMETLGDYGGVAYFGVHTLTTGVYDTWVYLRDLGSAAIIAIILLSIITIALYFEFKQRRSQAYYNRNSLERVEFKQLTGKQNFFAWLWCSLLCLVCFAIPSYQLLYWSYDYFDVSYNRQLFTFAWNSLRVATMASLVTVAISCLIILLRRIAIYQHGNNQAALDYSFKMTSIGYAIPSTVLAISVFAPMITLDHAFNYFYQLWHGELYGLVFSGTIFTLILAYTIRFTTMSNLIISQNISKINPNLDLASANLGTSGLKMLAKVHFPLLKTSIYTGAMLVFIEVLKDLNITLLLRPFNFETIATNLYGLASLELLEKASLSAVLIIAIGIIPVIIMTRNLLQENK